MENPIAISKLNDFIFCPISIYYHELENSDRILNNVITQIENKFEKQLDESDSILLFLLSSSCKVLKYGFPRHEDEELYIVE